MANPPPKPRAARLLHNATMQHIKDLILREGLRPGDPLPTESELCDMLEVSRSSVREAIRTLSALDIVEVRHGTGTFVGQMSLQPMIDSIVFRGAISQQGSSLQILKEIVDVRHRLDVSIGPSLVELMRGKLHPELDELVEDMTEKADRGEIFVNEDRAFHVRLVEPLASTLLMQLVEAFWKIHTVTAPMLGVPTPEDIAVTARSHGDMLRSAQEGDLAGYLAAVASHYAPLKRNIERFEAEQEARTE
ncbi:DNA-binding transcriptional regulator, FadR family [Bowdeniella nasicola]|uniref:DNA-binding transcriptional regulator, FadR family n=1 Tax=Bowdeniella nasicola TaxID=208480 RepID=A0A1H3YJM8_9ACTO|nr:GntR family transcriptional regulator [Bowdeniella nasicola]SEA11765.1 DNA-binding transcriptional regulator, FadR family [Bowdeniella nasicola]